MSTALLLRCGKWIETNDRIQAAHPVNGGWERWAQIDFNCYLLANAGATMTYLEDPCYVDGKIADLTVGPIGPPSPMSGVVMELKVFNAGESLAAYKAKILKDYVKLGLPMKANRIGYLQASYGIAHAPTLFQLLLAKYPGSVYNEATIRNLMEIELPAYKTVFADSARGEKFVITFSNVG